MCFDLGILFCLVVFYPGGCFFCFEPGSSHFILALYFRPVVDVCLNQVSSWGVDQTLSKQ